MENRRVEIGKILSDVLSCPDIGSECRCHFQPPSNVRMIYPAIVYELSDVPTSYADNVPYVGAAIYQCTLIDRDPETKYLEPILRLPKVRFVRYFVTNNLNHWVFTIY